MEEREDGGRRSVGMPQQPPGRRLREVSEGEEGREGEGCWDAEHNCPSMVLYTHSLCSLGCNLRTLIPFQNIVGRKEQRTSQRAVTRACVFTCPCLQATHHLTPIAVPLGELPDAHSNCSRPTHPRRACVVYDGWMDVQRRWVDVQNTMSPERNAGHHWGEFDAAHLLGPAHRGGATLHALSATSAHIT